MNVLAGNVSIQSPVRVLFCDCREEQVDNFCMDYHHRDVKNMCSPSTESSQVGHRDTTAKRCLFVPAKSQSLAPDCRVDNCSDAQAVVNSLLDAVDSSSLANDTCQSCNISHDQSLKGTLEDSDFSIAHTHDERVGNGIEVTMVSSSTQTFQADAEFCSPTMFPLTSTCRKRPKNNGISASLFKKYRLTNGDGVVNVSGSSSVALNGHGAATDESDTSSSAGSDEDPVGDGSDEGVTEPSTSKSSEANVMFRLSKRIDRKLERAAVEKNLTPLNVKTILHHMIVNEHMLSLIRNAVTVDSSNSNSVLESGADACEFRLTRSKARNLVEKGKTLFVPATTNLTTVNDAVSSSSAVLHAELADAEDDESDEDYLPPENEKDDLSRGSEFDESDLGSSCIPTPSTIRPLSVTPSSCSRRTLHTPVPTMDASSRATISVSQGTGETYAHVQRHDHRQNDGQPQWGSPAKHTRSKHSLRDVPLDHIEATLNDPDLLNFLDSYEVSDDPNYLDFLFKCAKNEDLNEVEDEDPEYNFMDDEFQDDREDYVLNKATRVSKRELVDLLADLLDEHGQWSEMSQSCATTGALLEDMSRSAATVGACAEQRVAGEEPPLSKRDLLIVNAVADLQPQMLDFAPPKPLPAKRKPSDEELAGSLLLDPTKFLPRLTRFEYEQFYEQMRMHVQLLSQAFLLCICESDLHRRYGILAKNMLCQLNDYAASSPAAPNTAFAAWNLPEALRIVSLECPEEEKSKIVEAKYMFRGHRLPGISLYAARTIAYSKAFIYPHLLPRCGPVLSSRIGKEFRNNFIPSEDRLLALGCYQFGHIWFKNKLIREHLLPVKPLRAITNRLKNLMYSDIPNDVKTFRKNDIEPKPDRKVICFNPDLVTEPVQWPHQYRPTWLNCAVSGCTKRRHRCTVRGGLFRKHNDGALLKDRACSSTPGAQLYNSTDSPRPRSCWSADLNTTSSTPERITSVASPAYTGFVQGPDSSLFHLTITPSQGIVMCPIGPVSQNCAIALLPSAKIAQTSQQQSTTGATVAAVNEPVSATRVQLVGPPSTRQNSAMDTGNNNAGTVGRRSTNRRKGSRAQLDSTVKPCVKQKNKRKADLPTNVDVVSAPLSMEEFWGVLGDQGDQLRRITVSPVEEVTPQHVVHFSADNATPTTSTANLAMHSSHFSTPHAGFQTPIKSRRELVLLSPYASPGKSVRKAIDTLNRAEVRRQGGDVHASVRRSVRAVERTLNDLSITPEPHRIPRTPLRLNESKGSWDESFVDDDGMYGEQATATAEDESFKSPNDLINKLRRKRNKTERVRDAIDNMRALPSPEKLGNALADVYVKELRSALYMHASKLETFVKAVKEYPMDGDPVQLVQRLISILCEEPTAPDSAFRLCLMLLLFLTPVQAATLESSMLLHSMDFHEALVALLKMDGYLCGLKHPTQSKQVFRSLRNRCIMLGGTRTVREALTQVIGKEKPLWREIAKFFADEHVRERPSDASFETVRMQDCELSECDGYERLHFEVSSATNIYPGSRTCRCSCHISKNEKQPLLAASHCDICSVKFHDGSVYVIDNGKCFPTDVRCYPCELHMKSHVKTQPQLSTELNIVSAANLEHSEQVYAFLSLVDQLESGASISASCAYPVFSRQPSPAHTVGENSNTGDLLRRAVLQCFGYSHLEAPSPCRTPDSSPGRVVSATTPDRSVFIRGREGMQLMFGKTAIAVLHSNENSMLGEPPMASGTPVQTSVAPNIERAWTIDEDKRLLLGIQRGTPHADLVQLLSVELAGRRSSEVRCVAKQGLKSV